MDFFHCDSIARISLWLVITLRAAIAAVLQFRRVRTGLVRPARRAALDRAVPVSACPRARRRCLPLCTSSHKRQKRPAVQEGMSLRAVQPPRRGRVGLLRYPRTTQVLPTPRMPPATLMPARPPTILPLPVARGLRVTLARFTPAPPRLARSPAWMIAVPSLRARVPRKIITILA